MFSRIALVMSVSVLVVAGCSDGSGGSGGPEVALSPAGVEGEQVAKSLACAACHSVNGDDRTGPTWKGLMGRSVTLTDGSTVTIDAEYITRAIRDPNAQRREGVKAVMPMFDEGRITDEQIDSIVAYITDLR